jgi:shikimate kinase
MNSAASNRRVFLIGFMGAGKTTVGKALAKRLGWSFRDLDEVIEAREQKTAAAVFAAAGEEGFRDIESAALWELLASTSGNCVVALGGGTFVQPGNRIALQQAGAITVWLEAPLDELKRRCKADGVTRPLALDETRLEQLFESRRGAYSLAQFRAETSGKTAEEVATGICSLLHEVFEPEVK